MVREKCKYDGMPRPKEDILVTLPDGGERYTIDQPPLELAVFDVRFATEVAVVALQEGFSIRGKLEEITKRSGWSVEAAEMHEFVLKVDVDGPHTQETAAQGVRLTHAEGDVEIAVFGGVLTVQVQKYRRWSESFQPYIEAALLAVEGSLNPVSISRVGLRYVNALKDQESAPAAWGERVSPFLSSFLTEGPFAQDVVAAHNQLQLRLGLRVEASLRHGLLPLPMGSGYLLDWDVYDVSSELFDVQDVLSTAERLNRRAAELFKSCLTADYLEMVGYRNIESKEGKE